MKFFITIFICILICALLILAFSYYAYRIAFYMPPRSANEDYVLPPGMTEENMGVGIAKCLQEMLKRPCEPVTITGYDGTGLFARYYHTADGAPVQIQFHGYKSSPFIDMSGGNLLARKMGHNVLAVDQRSHGKSQGNTITFGIKERKDCLSWINYARERFGPETPILLSGLSMGAATVLMAADLELPSNVKGIIADCPYSSPKEIILKTAGDMKFPVKLTYPFIRLASLMFGHFNLEETTAVKAVQHARVPILIIHGEADSFVPCHMSREIARVCSSPITLVTIPGAGHGRSYLVDPKHYEDAIIKFIDSVI